MDADKNWEALLNFLYVIMPGVIIILAGIIMIYYYNEEVFLTILRLMIPMALYLSGIGASFVIRKKKSKVIKADSGGTDQTTINISYMKFFLHDVLTLGTPATIILAAYFIKGEVAMFDIVASGIACAGLYLSELIYRKK